MQKKYLHEFDSPLLTWKAPEYIYHEKSFLWFIIAAIVAFLLVIYGLETYGWTFCVAVVVFAGVYYMFYRHKPEIIDVKLSRIGVKVGRHVFPYSNIRNFWIVYDPPFVKKIYFRMMSKLHPDIFVPLDGVDIAEVKHILSKYVEEIKGKAEPISDTLVRFFKL